VGDTDKVFEEMGDQDNYPSIPAGAGAGDGTAAAWRSIEKAYDVEHRHNQRLTDLTLQANMGAVQAFQAQMLGLVLLAEAGYPLQPNGVKTPLDAAAQAVGATGGSPIASP
jgi:hypothetical protein